MTRNDPRGASRRGGGEYAEELGYSSEHANALRHAPGRASGTPTVPPCGLRWRRATLEGGETVEVYQLGDALPAFVLYAGRLRRVEEVEA